MSRIQISTIVSSDHYQHYIPLYCHCLRKVYPQHEIAIGVVGKVDSITRKALECLDDDYIIRDCGDIFPEKRGNIVITQMPIDKYPMNISTINTMRFLCFLDTPDNYKAWSDYVLVTDIDLLFFKAEPNIIYWNMMKMKEQQMCYYTPHGPWKKPKRFPDSWIGDKERLSGGAVLLSKEWFKKTNGVLSKYTQLLKESKIGLYREEDEVMLCNICKEAGLLIPKDKYFPRDAIGVHLGDFKSEMDHRWQDNDKMKRRLSDAICFKYLEMDSADETWNKMKAIVMKGPEMKKIFDNFYTHLHARGL